MACHSVSGSVATLGLFGLIPILSALTACGSEPAKTAEKPFIPVVVSGGFPASYSLDDPDCQNGKEPMPLTRTTVRLWQDDQVADRQVGMKDVVSLGSITSPVVRETNFNDEYVRECDLAKQSGRACDDENGQEKGWRSTGPLRKLRICKDGYTYGRNTYEGVALSSLYYLESAYGRYLETFNNTLPQISLSVLPHFVDLYDNYHTADGTKRRKSYIMHNLAYFPAIKTVVVFPGRADDAAAAKGFFWESPFVLAHEFGHHIDFTSDQGIRERLGLQWDAMTHSFVDTRPGAFARGGASDLAQIHGAISEGFADLSAYYALKGNVSSLVGIPCFGYNRNVAEGTFLNGEEKILTPERFDFMLGRVAEEPRVCGQPRYGDIHIVGAIIAHVVDEAFMTLITEASNIPPRSDADWNTRYNLLSRWMQRLYQETLSLSDDASANDMLGPVTRSLAAVASQFTTNLGLRDDQAAPVRAKICRMVKDALPTAPDVPFAEQGRCP